MSVSFFMRNEPIEFKPDAPGDELVYRWYDPERRVLGKRMEDQLRFAVCYWHSFTWPGGDPFGSETFLRPWMHTVDAMEGARMKADIAFEMFRLLGVPFFTFHDRDIAPEGTTLAWDLAPGDASSDPDTLALRDGAVYFAANGNGATGEAYDHELWSAETTSCAPPGEPTGLVFSDATTLGWSAVTGATYDVIFDAVGKHSFRRCRNALRPGGLYIETDLGFLWHVPLLALATRWIGDKRVTLPIPRYTKEEVLLLGELVEAGEYRAVIDRTYPLEQVVEATRYVETGQKTGNVVLTVTDGGA